MKTVSSCLNLLLQLHQRNSRTETAVNRFCFICKEVISRLRTGACLFGFYQTFL
jgi:hypothetical protein